MTFVKDKNNNDISSSHKEVLLHYLQPDYIDKNDKTYPNNRCPLSMLAETCNNIGKSVTDNPLSQSQDSNLPISPSCSSSCSAPKFSPNSFECSPVEVSKHCEEPQKEKATKEKSKKRKAVKRENQEFMEKRMAPEHNGLLNSPYSIAEFLKMNNLPQNMPGKQDPNQFIHPFYNQLLNHNLNSQFQASSVWKSKSAYQPRMAFPMVYPNQNYSLNNSGPPQMFRPPQPNFIHELNHLYNNCQMERPSCDCVVCCHKRNMEKNMVKVDPALYNSMNCLRLPRPMNHHNMMPHMTQNPPQMNQGPSSSSIKYCMYCGSYIPLIQNLLNHIHSEHVDQISSNFQPKGADSLGNFSFSMESLQSKEAKSREILKQLHLMYNSDNADDNGDNKPLLMR